MTRLRDFARCIGGGLADFGRCVGSAMRDFGHDLAASFGDALWLRRERKREARRG